MMDERREYARYPIDFECTVFTDGSREVPCKIMDISEKGARLSPCELVVGDEVELSFLDDSDTFIKLYSPAHVTSRGKVVRLTGTDVGIKLYKSYALMDYINNRLASVYVERLRETAQTGE